MAINVANFAQYLNQQVNEMTHEERAEGNPSAQGQSKKIRDPGEYEVMFGPLTEETSKNGSTYHFFPMSTADGKEERYMFFLNSKEGIPNASGVYITLASLGRTVKLSIIKKCFPAFVDLLMNLKCKAVIKGEYWKDHIRFLEKGRYVIADKAGVPLKNPMADEVVEYGSYPEAEAAWGKPTTQGGYGKQGKPDNLHFSVVKIADGAEIPEDVLQCIHLAEEASAALETGAPVNLTVPQAATAAAPRPTAPVGEPKKTPRPPWTLKK
jgi:hypothetical protein